jgi:hypothetical protein
VLSRDEDPFGNGLGLVTLSRVDDDFRGGTSEQDFQPIQHVAAPDPFRADKVRLKSARVLLSIEPGPV